MTAYAMSWDPLREVEQLFAALDSDRFYNRAWSTAGDTPGVNVYADEETAVVTTELPGVQPGDVSVQMHEDVLSIAATPKTDAAAEAETEWLGRARPQLTFTRSVSLPFQVDPDHIEARLKDGVLTVALKRAAADRPRRIQITGN